MTLSTSPLSLRMGRQIEAQMIHVLSQDPHQKKKNTLPTGDQLTPECRWQRPCLLAKQNATASSTPSNQKGVSLWLEVPSRCHPAFIFHFSNGLDASHSCILKSQVHRESSHLLKMLKTCTSIYTVRVSRTLIIFSQNQNLATAPCHSPPCAGPPALEPWQWNLFRVI